MKFNCLGENWSISELFWPYRDVSPHFRILRLSRIRWNVRWRTWWMPQKNKMWTAMFACWPCKFWAVPKFKVPESKYQGKGVESIPQLYVELISNFSGQLYFYILFQILLVSEIQVFELKLEKKLNIDQP